MESLELKIISLYSVIFFSVNSWGIYLDLLVLGSAIPLITLVHTPPFIRDLSGVRADSYCRWMEDKQFAILFSQEVSEGLFTLPWHSRFCASESENCLFALLQFWSPENSSLYVIVMLIHISGIFFLFSPIYSIFLGSLLPTQCYSVSLVTDTNNPTNLLILFFCSSSQ